MQEQSVLIYFLHAGPVVKAVMLCLLSASVVSWTFIFQRAWYLRQIRMHLEHFSERFWSGGELSHLYRECENRSRELDGIWQIFLAGFREFARHRSRINQDTRGVLEAVQRSMQVSLSKEMDKLEQFLPFLATVGSVSPYVGLLGTVWGMMTAMQALGTAQQASIAVVAPGISEALMTTAMGLVAAIPAVIAYNRFRTQVDRILNEYDAFVEEFAGILFRQTSSRTHPTGMGSREQSSQPATV